MKLLTPLTSARRWCQLSLTPHLRACCPNQILVGRVTPCAPLSAQRRRITSISRKPDGAHGVTRPAFSSPHDLGNTPFSGVVEEATGLRTASAVFTARETAVGLSSLRLSPR